MAEGLAEPQERPLEKLQKEITCGVCQCLHEDAKLLPCNHYYCSMCIEKTAARSEGRPFECPECSEQTSLPAGGVTELPPALFVERMKDVYGKMARAEGKVEAFCGQCAAAKSVAFCRQCADFICEECVAIHEKLKAFASHVVISFDDLKKGGIKNVPLNEAPPGKCAEHDKTLKLFCFDCKSLICRDCTVFGHNGHKFEFLTKCAPESREKLRECLATLQKVQTNVEEAEKSLVSEEAKVDKQEDEVCRSIQESFEQLKAILDERKAELVNKTCSLAKERKDVLAVQKKELQAIQKEIKHLVEFVQRNIESTSDHDLINIQMQLQTKMEEEAKRHQNVALEPKATADISWHLPSSSILPRDVGLVYDKSSPPTLFNVSSTCEVDSPFEAILSAPTASLNEVFTSLQCVANSISSVSKGDVTQICVGIFKISVKPKVRGRHELIVRVRGQHVKASPFQVFVRLQLGKSMPRVITGACGPWGVAINSKQQLLVAQIYGNKVSIVDKKSGKDVQTIENYQFRDARGVVANSDGTIYVTDSYADRLFEFNSKGQLRASLKQSERPFSIKIINDHLYVTYPLSNKVRVYDMDYNMVGTIETKEGPEPTDIAQGPDGLYVAGDNTIGVYSSELNGGFIRHLNLTPSSLKLSHFNAICFDPCGHIIVSDGLNGVYMFKTSGECVGHVGKDAISGSAAAGITVDEDGFVYLCGCVHGGKVVMY